MISDTIKILKLFGAIIFCLTIIACSQHEETEKPTETNTMNRFNANSDNVKSVLTPGFIEEIYKTGITSHLEVEITPTQNRTPGPTDLQVIVAAQLTDDGWNKFLEKNPIVEEQAETVFPSFLINEIDEKVHTDPSNLDMEGVEIQADYIELEPTISKSPMRFGSSFKFKKWLIIFLITQ